MSDDTLTVLNPVQIEKDIRETVEEIARGVRITTDAEFEAARLRRIFDYDYAVACGRAEGSNAEARKSAAVIATMNQREAAENAEITFKHAQRLARALEKKLDALRSQGASVRAMYEVAGR